jgi:zinc/manganese transport system substrate-binding protein
MKKILILALFLVLNVPVHAQEAPVKAVASFSILGDIVKAIGGDDVSVQTLIGPDTDAHAYEHTPAEAKAIADADIVFINGLGFDDRVAKLGASEKKVIVTSDNVKLLESEGGDDGHGHGHNQTDPHAWQDVSNIRIYVGNIVTALSAIKPDKAQNFANRAAAYDQELQKLDSEIRQKLGAIPEEKRKIVTSHDAFGYFESAYGIKMLAAEGLTGHGSAKASNIAKLIDQIKTENVKTLFVENVSNSKLIEQIKADTGAVIGGTLYADALSKPDGPAATYIDMMRHNLSLIIQSMEDR